MVSDDVDIRMTEIGIMREELTELVEPWMAECSGRDDVRLLVTSIIHVFDKHQPKHIWDREGFD